MPTGLPSSTSGNKNVDSVVCTGKKSNAPDTSEKYDDGIILPAVNNQVKVVVVSV